MNERSYSEGEGTIHDETVKETIDEPVKESLEKIMQAIRKLLEAVKQAIQLIIDVCIEMCRKVVAAIAKFGNIGRVLHLSLYARKSRTRKKNRKRLTKELLRLMNE